MPTEVSYGISLVFGTSGWAPVIIDVVPSNPSREKIPTSHQGTTTMATFIPAPIADPGEWKLVVEFDPSDDGVPIEADPESIVATFADSETHTFTGFLTSFEPTGTLNDKMTANVTIAASGDTTIA